MKITGTLLAATAFTSIALGSIANANSYVTAFGGANWDDVLNDVNSKTGYVIGGAVGMNVKSIPGLRAELEASYRNNDVDFQVYCMDITAQHTTTAVMGNLVYGFDVGLPVHPHVLVGAGYASNEATIENLSLLNLKADGVAWQVGAGLETEVSPGVNVGVEYRYLATPDLTILNTDLSDGTNNSVLATVRLSLD